MCVCVHGVPPPFPLPSPPLPERERVGVVGVVCSNHIDTPGSPLLVKRGHACPVCMGKKNGGGGNVTMPAQEMAWHVTVLSREGRGVSTRVRIVAGRHASSTTQPGKCWKVFFFLLPLLLLPSVFFPFPSSSSSLNPGKKKGRAQVWREREVLSVCSGMEEHGTGR